MPLSILGLLHHNDACEYRGATRPFDVDFLRRAAQAFDAHGYDRVLIGQHARSPDPLTIAAFVTTCTKTLKFMIAHRPGFIAPTMAARMFATLDRLSRGRCAAHIITAGSDAETRSDGDFLTKAQRYARSREYVGILKSIWQSASPVDHDGDFYSFREGFSDVRPSADYPIPIFWGGASELGVAIGAECADVYAMGGSTLEKAEQLVAAVRAAAIPFGRQPRFCMSMRIIMAATEADAWTRAHDLRDRITAFRAGGGIVGRDKGLDEQPQPRSVESADRYLWDGLNAAVQGRTHITALVGTPDQLTDALMGYHGIGIDHFILTGFEPIVDSIDIGHRLIPRLKCAAAA